MTPNSQRRAHWAQVAKAKSETELHIEAALNRAGLTRLDGPISVRVLWFAPDARRRDVDSLAVFLKAVLDTLQRKRVIADDHSGIVHDVRLGPIVVSRDNPRLEVHIRGVEAGGGVPLS